MKLVALVLAAASSLTGCAQLGYYWQSVAGHLELMRAARPIEQWLADPNADAALKQRLELSRRLRAFAVTDLGLPDNASYQRYADIGRSSVVWNVVAAPELSLKAKTWCFPVAGCVAYRGYFSEAQALAEAAALRQEGMEAHVYGVPAYSTLGWMNWAGGDPLLSSFVQQPEADLARLLFHEMAHQVVYAKDDTTFNESFATAVERIGLRQWRASQMQGAQAVQDELAQTLAQARRAAFRALTQATRQSLTRIYATPVDGDREAMRRAKAEAMERFRAEYETLRASWLAAAQSLPSGTPAARSLNMTAYDRWVRNANNAALASLASYDDLVAAFELLFEREGRDWGRFYDAVRALAASPKAQRDETMNTLRKESAGG